MALLVSETHPGIFTFNPNKDNAYLCWVHANESEDFAPYYLIYAPLTIIYLYSFYILVRLWMIFRKGLIPFTFTHCIQTLDASKDMLAIFTLYNICVVVLGILTHSWGFYFNPLKYLMSSKGFCCLIAYLRIETFSHPDDSKSVRPILHTTLQAAVVKLTTFGIKSTALFNSRDEVYSMRFEPNDMMMGQDEIQKLKSGSQLDLQSVADLGCEKIKSMMETNQIRTTSTGTMRISPSTNKSSSEISSLMELLSIPLMVDIETRVQFVEYFPSIFQEIRHIFRVSLTYSA
jgi:hypothetical protein